MTKLIINADDFGYSPAINYGIVAAFSDGILTSTTLMANMPGFNHAIALSRTYPKLGIGAHLNLTCGAPILQKRYSSIVHNGLFLSLDQLKQNLAKIDLEDVYKEWDAQIATIYDHGIELTHLDSHHYVHAFGELYKVIELLAEKYALPIRNCFGVKDKLRNPVHAPADVLWNPFNYQSIKDMQHPYQQVRQQLLEQVVNDSQQFRSCQLVEAVCHPGYLDETIWFGSRFNLARMREVELLVDPLLKQQLQELGFQFCRYDEIAI